MIIPWVCFVLLFVNIFVCFLLFFFVCIVDTSAFYRELDIIKFNLKRKKEKIAPAKDDLWNKIGFRHLPATSAPKATRKRRLDGSTTQARYNSQSSRSNSQSSNISFTSGMFTMDNNNGQEKFNFNFCNNNYTSKFLFFVCLCGK